MSGIPVYTQSPINPAKASGVTPQTAAPQTQTTPVAPSQAPATTTGIPSNMPSYPSAKPGATVPAPTAAAQRYTPVQPTPTSKVVNDSPPAPQPGAVPTPPNSFNPNLPPPPKAGESFQAPQTTVPPPMAQSYPQQMSYSPPTNSFAGQPAYSSTSTTTAPSTSYPVALPNAGQGESRQSLEHPPGYHQNVYASELTSDQRRAQDTNNTPSGLGGFGGSETTGGLDSGSYWDAAKKWATTAADKISEGEKEVWRRINKE